MITNLSEFRATLRDYLNRPELTDAQVDQFIDNGRRAAAQYLAREQEQVTTLTLDAELSAPLPARFLAARVAYLEGDQAISERSSVFSPTEQPGYQVLAGRFRIVGDTQGQVVDGDQVTFHYYEFPEPLSGTVSITDYLTANADLWQWAAIEDGARFLDYKSMLESAIGAVGMIGPRVRALANSGRQWGGPRRMTVRR